VNASHARSRAARWSVAEIKEKLDGKESTATIVEWRKN
jgi:hypothetical protein